MDGGRMIRPLAPPDRRGGTETEKKRRSQK